MGYAKVAFKVIQYALTGVVVGVVALLLLGHFGYVNTFKPFVVQSGSMEPSIPVASIVFTLPQKSYLQGDVITFHPKGDLKQTVTHRIEFKLYPDGINGSPLFITAGDANQNVDNWQVKEDEIIGKAVLTIPYVGYVVDFAKKPEGFILMVIVPATIVIYEELKSLFLEIIKSIKNLKDRFFKSRTLKIRSDMEKAEKHKIDAKAWTIIPLIGAGVFLISFSAGYFSDIEKSIGNVLGAARNFGNESIQNPLLSTLEIRGNQNCQESGYTDGFKIEDLHEGTYPLTQPPGVLTGGAISDPANSITISNLKYKSDSEIVGFDWTSTLGIDAVLIKASTNVNIYEYNPEAFSGTGLESIDNPKNPKGEKYAISHIEFCYDYEE